MSEQSAEATVAGEAASAAVEELHEREAVVDAAQSAAFDAAIASEDAQTAVAASVGATEVSQTAMGAAAEASERADAAADISVRSYEELRAVRTELGEVRGWIIEQRQKEEAANAEKTSVAEVPVNDTAAREQTSNTDDTDSAKKNKSKTETKSQNPTSSGARRTTGLRRLNRGR
jgi:hypothetical protein